MEPYIGQIQLFAFPRVPLGWLACAGQLVGIADNEALFTLIGTTYGGDGIQSFGIPDLRGRIPLHQGHLPGGASYPIGSRAGAEAVTLLAAQTPKHSHQILADRQDPAVGGTAVPGPTVTFATASGLTPYSPDVSSSVGVAMAANSIGLAGGSLPHGNMMPTLFMNYCIATVGIYPSQG